jgi:hypothetical protein
MNWTCEHAAWPVLIMLGSMLEMNAEPPESQPVFLQDPGEIPGSSKVGKPGSGRSLLTLAIAAFQGCAV